MAATKRSLVLGTRGSRLAIWQAEWVQARLMELAPDVTVTLKKIKTSGDKILDVPLAQIGGKGLFVKEIEEALLSREIDLAVHSMKDMPTVLPTGLDIVGVPPREDPRDALIGREGWTLSRLPQGARVGTSSLRRQAQLLRRRPDLKIEMLRGNLDTRLKKLQAGEFDAIVLASAGLRRLGWAEQITEYLPFEVSLPAIGQGALGIEGRTDDAVVRGIVAKLEHVQTRLAVTAERALLDRLEGGCQVPIAAHATIADERLRLEGLVASLDGKHVVQDHIAGSTTQAQELGRQLAEQLLNQGGKTILDEIYGRA
ncbi:MAG: hydroxymethylbilane synthase [Nitrospira sp.]